MRVLLAALLFGAADAVQLWMNVRGIDVPPEILGMLPYVLALVVLSILAVRNGPAALGIPFHRELRG